MENNLLYVITMLLKDEIDKLQDINQVDFFLEHSKCGYLFDELHKIPDIQIYFKKVILKTVEIIERTFSFREINFSISEMRNEITKKKEEEEEKLGKKINKNNLDDFYNKIINTILMDEIILSKDQISNKTKERNEIFVKKYIPNLGLEDLKKMEKKATNENKNDLSEYYKKLANDITKSNNKNLYSNIIILKKIFDTNIPTYVYAFYQSNFLEIISFVEQLINDLRNNILLLPNSIKYICKVISILLKNKFKNITKIEENAFISKFLLGKLLIPIISLPNLNALIDEFVISGITLKNIKLVIFILKKLNYQLL